MRRRMVALLTGWLLAAAWPSAAWAGMPSPLPTDVAQVLRLTESAHARFQAISFFLVVLLGSALLVWWLWNRLTTDLPRLPRLSYAKALAVVVLWGLGFLVVLTMIAATRELMTPGTWQKQGLLYSVPTQPPSPEDRHRAAARRESLKRLHDSLSLYAAQHKGRFPANDKTPAIDPAHWELPGGPGLRYRYVPGRSAGVSSAIIVYEPAIYGDDPFVLRANGEIAIMPEAALDKALAAEKQP